MTSPFFVTLLHLSTISKQISPKPSYGKSFINLWIKEVIFILSESSGMLGKTEKIFLMKLSFFLF